MCDWAMWGEAGASLFRQVLKIANHDSIVLMSTHIIADYTYDAI